MNRFRDLARRVGPSEPIVGGVAGRAKIESVVGTGLSVEDNPEVQLTMTIDLPGRSPYPTTHRQVVSRLVLHQLEPGSDVPVRVDPEDLSRIEIG